MTERSLTILGVNALGREAFVARFGGLFEGSPWIAAAAWGERPFADRADLHAKLCGVVARAPRAAQEALISAHPDLVGRAALAGTLTRESRGEQAAAGLDPGRLTPAEVARFESLNGEYRARFGFPFVICARDHPKDAILAGFAARLGNDRETEIAVALAEIGRIGWHRLEDGVTSC